VVESSVPAVRLRAANDAPVRGDRELVLYWMIAARRIRFNFALERAADWARELGLPLVILEAVRCDYPWASDRLHRFILDGMADNRDAVDGRKATYHPYVEPERGHGSGLLEALAGRAAVVVTDEFPTFFLPRMVAAAAGRLDVRLEAVDGNGLIPLASTDRAYPTAHSFRRHVQKTVVGHLDHVPLEDPLAERMPKPAPLPAEILERWPAAEDALLRGGHGGLARLPLDHSVAPAPLRGGAAEGQRRLERFLDERLERYDEDRNRPDDDAASGLSPYLHFGHVAAHEVFLRLVTREGWTPDDPSGPARGQREGWWGLRPPAEAFLDQLVTWRELGFVFCHHRSDHDRWESLPDWARATLLEHADDPREELYGLVDLDASRTSDRLWNAAQTQLREEGRIHNYLRMLWGKKVLEWTDHPRRALEILVELNNRYALDGRDPNSSSGIFWVLGRHDRPWGPERPIFGKVRYMTSENTARKLPVKGYLERYAPEDGRS